MPTARLADGREVDTASPEWKAHTLAVWTAEQRIVDKHVENLKGYRPAAARAGYIADVERKDGLGIAQRVRAGFAEWFEAEKKRRADLARRSAPTG